MLDIGKYYQTRFLGLTLTDEQRRTYAKQLKKNTDAKGVSLFKKSSVMQKAWNEEVTDKVDFDILDKTRFWWINLINHGSYNLWDKNGNIYGYLKDDYKETIQLPEHMTEIKMSEYYSVLETFAHPTEKGGAE